MRDDVTNEREIAIDGVRTQVTEHPADAAATGVVLHQQHAPVAVDRHRDRVVPAGVEHTYEIVEALTAVEATSPPAQEAGRDAPPS